MIIERRGVAAFCYDPFVTFGVDVFSSHSFLSQSSRKVSGTTGELARGTGEFDFFGCLDDGLVWTTPWISRDRVGWGSYVLGHRAHGGNSASCEAWTAVQLTVWFKRLWRH